LPATIFFQQMPPELCVRSCAACLRSPFKSTNRLRVKCIRCENPRGSRWTFKIHIGICVETEMAKSHNARNLRLEQQAGHTNIQKASEIEAPIEAPVILPVGPLCVVCPEWSYWGLASAKRKANIGLRRKKKHAYPQREPCQPP
jgi:hypothetical protein